MIKQAIFSAALLIGTLLVLVVFVLGGSVGAQCPLAQRPPQVLRHVVLFKFNEGTSAENIRKIEQEFCALPGKIDAIIDFEWGTDVSTENLSEGFTHCFVVTFRDEAGRAAYLPHEEHEAFVALLQPHLAKALVVDYWTRP